MSLDSRLKKAEDKYIKSAAYRKGMKIMKQITELDQGDEKVIDFLVDLWTLGNPKKSIIYLD